MADEHGFRSADDTELIGDLYVHPEWFLLKPNGDSRSQNHPKPLQNHGFHLISQCFAIGLSIIATYPLYKPCKVSLCNVALLSMKRPCLMSFGST